MYNVVYRSISFFPCCQLLVCSFLLEQFHTFTCSISSCFQLFKFKINISSIWYYKNCKQEYFWNNLNYFYKVVLNTFCAVTTNPTTTTRKIWVYQAIWRIFYSSWVHQQDSSFSCNVALRDTKPLRYLKAAVLNNQLYYCGGIIFTPSKECYKNDRGNWVAVFW